MAIKLSEKDHRAMNVTLDAILLLHSEGKVTLGEARGALAHVVTAAAIGNEGQLRGWLKPETVAEWKRRTRGTP